MRRARRGLSRKRGLSVDPIVSPLCVVFLKPIIPCLCCGAILSIRLLLPLLPLLPLLQLLLLPLLLPLLPLLPPLLLPLLLHIPASAADGSNTTSEEDVAPLKHTST